MRLAREAANQDEAEGHNANLESIMENNNTEDDKIYAAMGVAKTIGTVSSSYVSLVLGLTSDQIVSSIESAPEILAQVQEVIIPIIMFSLEHKIIGAPLAICAQ
jgi:hypothetical protein